MQTDEFEVRGARTDTASMSGRSPRGYVLVYHARSELPGELPLDKTNDPELRQSPATWGICRTNVRGWVREGDDLFFVALADGRYSLYAHFPVGARIGHDEARRRFGPRQNVIVDWLPEAATLQHQLRSYVLAHQDRLVWRNARRMVELAAQGLPLPEDLAVQLGDSRVVHSYWDQHDDWLARLRNPYVVAREEQTRILKRPVDWAEVRSSVRGLPESLRINNPQTPHTPKRLEPSQHRALLTFVLSGAGRNI